MDITTVMNKEEFINNALDLLSPFFKGREQAEKWLYIKNPAFGYVSPIEMYNLGKGNLIFNFIKVAKIAWDL